MHVAQTYCCNWNVNKVSLITTQFYMAVCTFCPAILSVSFILYQFLFFFFRIALSIYGLVPFTMSVSSAK